MRLFIAIPLDETVKELLRAAQREIRSWQAGVSLARDFHVTLKFLGDMREDRVQSIVSALEKVSFCDFSFHLVGLGFFPNARSPRVVWAGVEPVDEIVRLQKDIDKALIKLGFEPDSRFHPHITLARVKWWKSGGNIEIPGTEQKVETFELIHSTLTPEGPVYKTIQSFKRQL